MGVVKAVGRHGGHRRQAFIVIQATYLRKIAFYRHLDHIWLFLELFEKTKVLKFGSHLKELNCPASSP